MTNNKTALNNFNFYFEQNKQYSLYLYKLYTLARKY